MKRNHLIRGPEANVASKLVRTRFLGSNIEAMNIL